ncbi:hypothetical protein AGMMS50225_01610 [Betaproteobacteria bacterium]|nr:hypothetical protein AGMMS50225_01610 [Betaproteobacteria bacterium]
MTERLLLSLSQGLANGKLLVDEQSLLRLARRNDGIQQGILSDLKTIGKSGNLESIIAAEKSIVKFELNEYANSKSMVSSLQTALEELEAIETNIRLVAEPEQYPHVDASHAQRKLRDTHDLPLDGARIAFRSHHARLSNYDKSKSDDHEKAIIQARQQNIRIAEKIYIERQEKALDRKAGA